MRTCVEGDFEKWNLTDDGNAVRDEFGLSSKAAALIDGFGVGYLLSHNAREIGMTEALALGQGMDSRRDLAEYVAELESALADARGKA